MNTKGSTVRYRGTATGCGVTPKEITLAERQRANGTWLTEDPPVVGKIARVKVEKLLGSGTTVVDLDVLQGSGGDQVVGWVTELLDMDLPVDPGPLYYRVDTASDLISEITIDDGGDATNVRLTVEIEVD